MRKSASEIIGGLESRVAKLESQNKVSKLTLEKELRQLNENLEAVNKMIKAYEVFEDLQITFGAFSSEELSDYIGDSFGYKVQYKYFDGINFFDGSEDLDGFIEVLVKAKKELQKEIKELKRNPPIYV